MTEQLIGSIGAGEVARLLRSIPTDVRRKLRPALQAAGQLVRDRAASNASWSTRIPASLAVRTSGVQGRPAVSIVASAAVAPHARPYEGIAGGMSFRHPVYGSERIPWVAQAARPFLAPAVQQAEPQVIEAVGRVIDDVLN